MKTIHKYEHGSLHIGEEGFKEFHWNAFVKLNAAHEGKYFDVLPKGLKFKQYVGVIQVDGLLVQIHPKADKDDQDEKWKGVLLSMLKTCGRLKAKTLGNAFVKKQHLNLLEVYFEYFLREVEGLLHRGLIKQYRKNTGNVKALKGKLEFAGNIRHNLVHKERFHTTHQVYDTNHKIHQILALTLDIIGQFTHGTRLNDIWRRTQLSFPEVDRIKVNAKTLDSINLSRKSAPYERALELARLIILNYSPDINKGNQKMIALLFDMNELWEEYIYVQLKKEVNNFESNYKNFEVLGQSTKPFWANNYLKPDIVLRDKLKEKTFIIDTKWKRPINSASIEDLRQVYAYARFWNADKVMLLYPGNESVSNFVEYENTEYLKNNDTLRHACSRGTVSVLKLNNDKFILDDRIGEVVLDMCELSESTGS